MSFESALQRLNELSSMLDGGASVRTGASSASEQGAQAQAFAQMLQQQLAAGSEGEDDGTGTQPGLPGMPPSSMASGVPVFGSRSRYGTALGGLPGLTDGLPAGTGTTGGLTW